APAQNAAVRVIEATDAIVRDQLAAQENQTFAHIFGATQERRGVIGHGATLDISVWEAPPAVLFPTSSGVLVPGAPATGASTTFAGQVVNADGAITVPFAGKVQA
ncbi:hypothetical protein ACQ10I_15145, partial [Enterococcus faecalis]